MAQGRLANRLSRLTLAGVYFLVLTPIGLVLRLARVDLLRLRFRGYPSESFFVRVRAPVGWRWFRRSNRRRRGDAGVDASAPDTMYPLW